MKLFSASKSDVLVENFVPGALERKGLDYKSLCKAAPQLVYCSITGFGSHGPYQRRYVTLGLKKNLIKRLLHPLLTKVKKKKGKKKYFPSHS